MSNYKIKRISSDIKKCIGKILLDFKFKKIKCGIISVVRTEPSADLSFCKVYVSIMGKNEESDKIFDALESDSAFFRKELALRMNLRKTPQIKFYKNDFLNYSYKIEQILKKINKSRRNK